MKKRNQNNRKECGKRNTVQLPISYMFRPKKGHLQSLYKNIRSKHPVTKSLKMTLLG